MKNDYCQTMLYCVGCVMILCGSLSMLIAICIGKLALTATMATITVIGSIVTTKVENAESKKIIVLNPAGIFMRDCKK